MDSSNLSVKELFDYQSKSIDSIVPSYFSNKKETLGRLSKHGLTIGISSVAAGIFGYVLYDVSHRILKPFFGKKIVVFSCAALGSSYPIFLMIRDESLYLRKLKGTTHHDDPKWIERLQINPRWHKFILESQSKEFWKFLGRTDGKLKMVNGKKKVCIHNPREKKYVPYDKRRFSKGYQDDFSLYFKPSTAYITYKKDSKNKVRLEDVENTYGTTQSTRYTYLQIPYFGRLLEGIIEKEKLSEWVYVAPIALLPIKEHSNIGSTRLYCHYFNLAYKEDVIQGTKEMVKTINNWESEKQQKTAEALCTLIEKGGFMDCHFKNIMLGRKSDRLCIVDTKPFGRLIEASDSHALSSPMMLERCALIGLEELRKKAQQEGLECFVKVAKKRIQDINSRFWWKYLEAHQNSLDKKEG